MIEEEGISFQRIEEETRGRKQFEDLMAIGGIF
jgi:hypothetical protein